MSKMQDGGSGSPRFVHATHLDTIRIEVLGRNRAVTMPAGLILDVHDALQAADIEDLLLETGKALNALNGANQEAENVLCRVTALCTALLSAGQ